MRIVLNRGIRHIELVQAGSLIADWPESGNAGRMPIEGLAAEVYLRQFASDRFVLSRMRTMVDSFARGGLALPRTSDRAVIDEICRAVSRGELLLLEIEKDAGTERGTSGSSPAPKPSEPLKVVPPAPIPAGPPPKKTCSNPACTSAFQDAADNGSPLVSADAPDC